MTSTCTPIVLFVLCFSSIVSLTAQDWAPLRYADQTYAYRYSLDESYRYVRVEEKSLEETDSLFHLNSIMRPCDTCGRGEFILRNQAHFLQKKIKKIDSGVYHFQDTGSFVIHAFAGLGEEWLFDTLANVSATVTSIEQETLWDQTDSVKTITLSSGETIRLSKQHGIIEFPAFGIGGSYTLKGIQGKKLGIDLPMYKDFYDYNIGDEFQMHKSRTTAYVGYADTIIQYTIIDKRVDGNEISYDIEGIGHSLDIYTYICCDTLDNSNFEFQETLTFVDRPDHPLNHLFTRYPMSRVEGFGPTTSPVVLIPNFNHEGGLTGSMTVNWRKFYVFNVDSSDIGISEDWIESYYLDWNQPETKYVTMFYENGVGPSGSSEYDGYEYSYRYGVSALKRDGQVYGEWIADIITKSSQEDSLESPSNEHPIPICDNHEITYFPNNQGGDRGFVLVEMEDIQRSTVSLLGMNGQKIMEENFVEATHPLILPAYLAKGVYIVQLKGVDACISRRKILVR